MNVGDEPSNPKMPKQNLLIFGVFFFIILNPLCYRWFRFVIKNMNCDSLLTNEMNVDYEYVNPRINQCVIVTQCFFMES